VAHSGDSPRRGGGSSWARSASRWAAAGRNRHWRQARERQEFGWSPRVENNPSAPFFLPPHPVFERALAAQPGCVARCRLAEAEPRHPAPLPREALGAKPGESHEGFCLPGCSEHHPGAAPSPSSAGRVAAARAGPPSGPPRVAVVPEHRAEQAGGRGTRSTCWLPGVPVPSPGTREIQRIGNSQLPHSANEKLSVWAGRTETQRSKKGIPFLCK